MNEFGERSNEQMFEGIIEPGLEGVLAPERFDKLKKGIKVVIGGPPHSGKSVFIKGLSENIDLARSFLFSACPDGEGPWLQRHYDDPEVREWRRKGKFTPEFVERAARVVQDWEGPLMLIDIGGIISPENTQIIQGATHAIVLAGDTSVVPEWEQYFAQQGIEVIASLRSDYHGIRDKFEGAGFLWSDKVNDPVRASVHYLERGESMNGREMLQLVGELLEHLVDTNKPYQEAHENAEQGDHFVVDLPSFMEDLPSETVTKTLSTGKVVHNKRLLRSSLSQLYETVDKSFYAGKPVWLNGPINSWEAVALACAFQEAGNPEVRLRSPDGYVPLRALPVQGQGDTLPWQVTPTDELNGVPVVTVHADVGASTRILNPAELETMQIPEVPEQSIVIISMGGPNWLRASMALGYKTHVSAIAAFQPGEGATIAWSKDERAPLGEVIKPV